MKISGTHPDYDRYIGRWRMAWDFWRGGLHVREPDWGATGIRFANARISTGDDAVKWPAIQWSSSLGYSYLHKHEREGAEQYSDRQNRQIHFPIFQGCINTLSAAVLKQKADREKTTTNPWMAYYDNVDLIGTNIDAFIRQALSLCLVFGRIHAVTDRMSFETPAMSRAEEVARGDRAFSYLVTPLDLLDWSVDRFGRFNWVKIREDKNDVRTPLSERDTASSNYRVWYPDRWELWTEEKEKPVLISSGVNYAGEIPIATLFAPQTERMAQMASESPLADVLDIDRDILNKLSELDELERVQSFSLLCIPQVEGSMSGGIDVSPYSAITVDSQAGMPTYVSPDHYLAEGKWARIKEKYSQVRQLTGLWRQSEASLEARSGASIDAEGDDRKNQLSQLIASVREFEGQLLSSVGALEGQSDVPVTRYGNDYDQKGVFARIQEVVQLASLNIVNNDALTDLVTPIVARMMRENGAEQNEIDDTIKQIEDNVPDDNQNNAVPSVRGGTGPLADGLRDNERDSDV